MIRNILKWIKQGWKMVGEPFWIDLEGLFILGASILVHFGPFCFYFGKNWNWKNRPFKIDSNQSPLYNMFGMAIGSFHGFGKKSTLTWFSRVKSKFSVFPGFSNLLVKVWILLILILDKKSSKPVQSLIVEPYCFYNEDKVEPCSL